MLGMNIQGGSFQGTQLFPFPCVSVQLEQSEAKCEDALKTQKALTLDLESMHSELENMTRNKTLVLSLPAAVEAWMLQASGC